MPAARLVGVPAEEPLVCTPEADVVILRKRDGRRASTEEIGDVVLYRQFDARWNRDSRGEIPFARSYADDATQRGRTIGDCGCGLASLAMILASAGLRAYSWTRSTDTWTQGELVNPRNLADFFINYCEKNYGNDVWRILHRGSGALKWGTESTDSNPLCLALTFLATQNAGREVRVGYTITTAGVDPETGTDIHGLTEALDQGKPAILLTAHGEHGNGHYVVAVGYKREVSGSRTKRWYYANDPGYNTGACPYGPIQSNTLGLFSEPRTSTGQRRHLLCRDTTRGGPYSRIRTFTVMTGLDELLNLVPWNPCGDGTEGELEDPEDDHHMGGGEEDEHEHDSEGGSSSSSTSGGAPPSSTTGTVPPPVGGTATGTDTVPAEPSSSGGSICLVRAGRIGRGFVPRTWRGTPPADAVSPGGTPRIHAGQDILGERRTPIYAVLAGTVVHAGPKNGYGNLVIIRHSDPDCHSNYAHQDELCVTRGQVVTAGTQVGYMGNTTQGPSGSSGRVRSGMGVHLHFSCQRVTGTTSDDQIGRRFSSHYEETVSIRWEPRLFLAQINVAMVGSESAGSDDDASTDDAS